jgi:hypothetical protein
MVDDVQLIVDQEAIRKLRGLVDRGEAPESTIELAAQLPSLTMAHRALLVDERRPVGFSSAGSLAAALELSRKVENKAILIVLYDHVGNYDDDLVAGRPWSAPA